MLDLIQALRSGEEMGVRMPIKQRNVLDAQQAEELFEKVDETGHSNKDAAERQRSHRRLFGHGVEVDPLSGDDPSGSTVEKSITKVAITVILIFLAALVLAQVSCGVARRLNTANLSDEVNVRTVASALSGGVEWGNGFTQFPDDFTIQEASEDTGRVEVTVIDTSSRDTMECFAGSQIQATAFAVNALLNPNIDTVIYHVQVHRASDGTIERSSLFGFLKPTGDLESFMTFIWRKSTSANGRVNFTCTIAGMDEDIQTKLRSEITTWSPTEILGLGDAGDSSDPTDSSSSTSTSSGTSSSSSSTTSSSTTTSTDTSSTTGDTQSSSK